MTKMTRRSGRSIAALPPGSYSGRWDGDVLEIDDTSVAFRSWDVTRVLSEVNKISALDNAGDHEQAHGREDELYQDLLVAIRDGDIAEGCSPVQLARAALRRSGKLGESPRWTA